MAQGDLDISLLHRMMVRLGELRDRPPNHAPIEQDLMNLVKEMQGPAALNYLQRHADYLRDIGLLKINPGGVIWRKLTLTPKGHAYVQPELTEFGQPPILPALVKSIETQIATSSVPESKKEGMIHQLRKAIADNTPDIIAKVMVEIGTKILGG